jgi:preprotein translocase subunit SecG
MLRVILTIIQVFASAAIIALVLLQRYSVHAARGRRSRVPRQFLPRCSW